MKKILLFLLSSVLCYGLAFANDISNTDALAIAKKFYNSHITTGGMQKAPAINSLTLSYDKKIKDITGDSVPAFYVFNNGNKGFVIVSGSDATKQILGYSDVSSFDINHCPDNMKSWLDNYAKEIKYANSLPKTTISTIYKAPQKVSSSTTLATSVAPLLGNIKWNQDSPYNNLCPIINTSTGDRAVTGCVATAMAQIMMYYKWPVQGTGSNSYTTTTLGLNLSLDFSKTTFDWTNMTDTYSSTSTAAQNNAVATLMYNCGVAINMDYNTESSAYSTDMAKALINHFSYDSNLQKYSRDYYTRNEWTNILKANLNASMPIDYDGHTTTDGHNFVIDGYDSNGLFHVNWGWSGISNGYFEISALNPDVQGIGGSTGGYDYYQSAIIGIQKPNSTSKPVYLIYADGSPTSSTTSTTRTSSFSISDQSVYNRGINTFNGSIGIGIYQNGTLMQTTGVQTTGNLPSSYGWASISFNAKIGTTLPDGTYQIYPIYKASTETSWQIIKCLVGHPDYINMTLSGANVSLSTPTTGPVLSVDSLATTGNLYQDIAGRIALKVSNSGDEYNSVIGVKIQSASVDSINQVMFAKVDLVKGESQTVNLNDTIKLPPGQYYISALYDANNSYLSLNGTSDLSQLGSSKLTTNILSLPTDTANLTLSNAISFSDNNAVDKNNAVLTATIKNTSGVYSGKLIAFIFPASGGYSLTYIGYHDEVFDTNEEKTVNFSGSINLDPGQYQVEIFGQNTKGNWQVISPKSYAHIQFNLVDSPTATPNVTAESKINAYPNPVVNNLKVVSNSTINNIKVTDLSGRVLLDVSPGNSQANIAMDQINSGIYLLNIETANGHYTKKIIKQ